MTFVAGERAIGLDTSMQADGGYARGGGMAALINAACFFVGAVLFTLVQQGVIGPAEPTYEDAATTDAVQSNLIAFFGYVEAGWPFDLATAGLFTAGFLALIGVGVGLRGRGQRSFANDLMAATLAAGAILGAASQMLVVAGRDLLARYELCNCETELMDMLTLNATRIGLEEFGGRWLGLASFLLIGIGVYLASTTGRRAGVTATWWMLGIVVAVLYFAGVVAQLFLLGDLFDIIVGIGGGILAPLWALLLARELRAAEPQSGVAAD